jgi:L-fuculose-phosphate aldolase
VNGNEYALRQEIVKVGHLMYEKGFIVASDGNISARLGNGRLLITPSGLHKGFLEPEQILIIDENGQQLDRYANRHLQPTSELPMHLEAYRQRPDIQAVVHAHPPISVALSIAGISMTDCLLPEVIVFLGLVPTTEYATPSSKENVRAIRELIGRHDALILQRHGSLTVGNSPMQGFMRLETVEQNARIGFMLAQLGIHNPLPPEEVRKLLRQRQKMGLSRPGEAEEFCVACGVCHADSAHTPTLRAKPEASSQKQAADVPDVMAIQQLVAQVVNKTIGDY